MFSVSAHALSEGNGYDDLLLKVGLLDRTASQMLDPIEIWGSPAAIESSLDMRKSVARLLTATEARARVSVLKRRFVVVEAAVSKLIAELKLISEQQVVDSLAALRAQMHLVGITITELPINANERPSWLIRIADRLIDAGYALARHLGAAKAVVPEEQTVPYSK
jgi:hypothetical protein